MPPLQPVLSKRLPFQRGGDPERRLFGRSAPSQRGIHRPLKRSASRIARWYPPVATAAAPKIAEKLHEVLVLENWSFGCEPSAVTRSSQDAGVGQVERGIDVRIADWRQRAASRGVRGEVLSTLRGSRLSRAHVGRGDGQEWLDVVDQRRAPRLRPRAFPGKIAGHSKVSPCPKMSDRRGLFIEVGDQGAVR